MEPFDSYPDGGRLSGRRPTNTDNCRCGYGLELYRWAKLGRCAYCGTDLVHDFESWLLTTVDHVIPTGEGQLLGVRPEWLSDFANLVLCCSGCNTFDNKYKIPENPAVETEEQFLDLRDRVFANRKGRILERRAVEMRLFDKEWRWWRQRD